MIIIFVLLTLSFLEDGASRNPEIDGEVSRIKNYSTCESNSGSS